MLISLHRYRNTVRVTALSIVTLVCVLPYGGDFLAAQDRPLCSFPSELMTDGEESGPAEPTMGAFPSQDCALTQPYSWPHAVSGYLTDTGDDPVAQGKSDGLYPFTARPSLTRTSRTGP